MKDFFISYTRVDKEWAEWIAWELEATGYSVHIQAWDFLAGESFVANMQKGAAECKRTIAVLSPDYFKSDFTAPEWEAAFAQDPRGVESILLTVRVRKCRPTGLLSRIAYIDLVDIEQDDAQRVLLEEVSHAVQRTRRKPSEKPTFPTSLNSLTKAKPAFPSKAPTIWNMPHLRNPHFTGREDILKKLEAALISENTAAKPQAIVGLGGIGKSQIALEFAYRNAAYYE
ncbi:MAG: toll/interleukin-1 receptor domain-containing protein, partial [Calditrichota bacterium]